MVGISIQNSASDGTDRILYLETDDPSRTDFQITVPATASASQINTAVVAAAASQAGVSTAEVLLFRPVQ